MPNHGMNQHKKYPKSLRERFDKKWTPEPNTGCWLWIPPGDRDGYGTFHVGPGKRHTRAHKAAMLIYRNIPLEASNNETHWDHLCNQPACVNPDHLRLVSAAQNVLRAETGRAAQNLLKTHCPRGHDLSIMENLDKTDLRKGKRSCYVCIKFRRTKAFKKYGYTAIDSYLPRANQRGQSNP